MVETVVIDIEAQYRDRTSDGVRGSSDDMERLRRKMEDTESAGKKANAALEKIATTAASIAKKTITIPVKILDYATKPLRSLLNYATSLKGILTGIVMGQTAQKLFVSPTQYAETLKGHSLAFENLLGSAEAAAQMIQEIQAFDEKSPFNTMQIIEQSRMLMTYKLATQENVLSMIETIGDASMGVGAGDEGIERIVRALGQMKAKGKVSAEEMLQLSEVNISGWQYLADALGVTTAEVQDMTSKNKINVDDAINYLLAGMQKDFGGMANENAAKTLSGVWGQISSVLENGPFLRWGQGLSEGAMLAATTASGWLEDSKEAITELGDELYALGKSASTYAADKIIQFGDSVKTVLNSDEFKNADGIVEKLKIAWDWVIAEPFDQWWNTDGQAFLGNVAGKIGMGLGKFFNGAITTILGIDADSAAEGGVSIGAKFAEGFLEGFDAKKVWESIKKAFSNALKIIPGGEEATTSSWISAALLGYGGMKVAGAVSPLLSGLGGLGGAAAGSTKAAELAIMMGGGNLAGGASLSAGALSALGVASGAGLAIGGLGVVSGLADLVRSSNTMNRKEQSEKSWSGAAKLGMVGTGAAAGAAIGTIVPVIGTAIGAAIGAGLGGIGALFAGNQVGSGISDYFDGTGKIRSTVEEIKAANDAFLSLQSKAQGVETLMAQYEALQEKISGGKLNTEEMTTAQSELKTVVEQLASVYPGLISQYDLENGKLEEKLGLLRDVTEAERDRARKEAELASVKGDRVLPDLETAIERSQADYQSYDDKASEYMKWAQTAQELYGQWTGLKLSYDSGRTSREDFLAQKQEIMGQVNALEEKTGINLVSAWAARGNDLSGLEAGYDKIMDQAEKAMEARQTEQGNLDDLLAQYQEIYNSKMALAINPKGLDLAATEVKMAEINQLAEDIAALESDLSAKEKGTEEYEQTAQKIADAKTRQQELTASVEDFLGPLQDVLDAITEINRQFSYLPTDMKLSADTLGLGNIAKYVESNKATATTSTDLSETLPLTNTSPFERLEWGSWLVPKGFAKGTISAPPGKYWVGENGPELLEFRGGERVYSNTDSMRIAAETARSNRSTGGTGGIQVNLGGLNVSITGGGDSRDIMDQLKDRLPELSNQLCAMIATQLSRSYANMPTNATEGI